MKIDNLIEGRYISRPTRFTVKFLNKNGNEELAHLHDPGRLKELLIENKKILVKYVKTYKKTGRKTKYDVIAIEYENQWVLINSSFHNNLVKEILINKNIEELKDFNIVKPEYTYGNSRIDFLLKNIEDKEMLLEVKGCTLKIGDIAKFPDAPTIRGTKHLNELINARNKNKLSCVLILILQNHAKMFMPNDDTDPTFSKTLKNAYDNNVIILPTHINTKYFNNKLHLEYEKILPLRFN